MMGKLKRPLLLLGFLCVLSAARSQSIPSWKLAELTSAINNAKGPTIINFWATFCKPCIAELPHFQTLAKKYQDSGVHLIMVSLDLPEAYPVKVASFAKRLRLTSPVIFLNESNADLFCPAVDSTWSGSIPATLFVNSSTGYRRFYEQEFSKQELEAEIKRLLTPTASTK